MAGAKRQLRVRCQRETNSMWRGAHGGWMGQQNIEFGLSPFLWCYIAFLCMWNLCKDTIYPCFHLPVCEFSTFGRIVPLQRAELNWEFQSRLYIYGVSTLDSLVKYVFFLTYIYLFNSDFLVLEGTVNFVVLPKGASTVPLHASLYKARMYN